MEFGLLLLELKQLIVGHLLKGFILDAFLVQHLNETVLLILLLGQLTTTLPAAYVRLSLEHLLDVLFLIEGLNTELLLQSVDVVVSCNAQLLEEHGLITCFHPSLLESSELADTLLDLIS